MTSISGCATTALHDTYTNPVSHEPLRRQLAQLNTYTGADAYALSEQHRLIRTYTPRVPWDNTYLIPSYLRCFQDLASMPFCVIFKRKGGLRPLCQAMDAWIIDIRKGHDSPEHHLTHVQHLLTAIVQYIDKRPQPPLKMLWVLFLGGRLSTALREIQEHLHPTPIASFIDTLAMATPHTAHNTFQRILEAPYNTPAQRCELILQLFEHPSGSLLNAAILQDLLYGRALATLNTTELPLNNDLFTDPIVTSSAVFQNICTHALTTHPSNPFELLHNNTALQIPCALWKTLISTVAPKNAACFGYLHQCNDLWAAAQNKGFNTQEDPAFLEALTAFTPTLYHQLNTHPNPTTVLETHGFTPENTCPARKFMFSFLSGIPQKRD